MTLPVRVQVSQRAGPPGRLGRVRNVGRIDRGRGVPTGPLRRFDGHALTLVFRGFGRYRDGRLDLPLGPGSVITVTPGHPHWYGVVDASTWDEVHLVFDGPVFDLAAERGLLDPGRPVRLVAPVESWLARMEDFRTRRPPLTIAGADHEVGDVLRLLVDLAAADEPRAPDPRGWLATSKARLGSDLGQPLALAEVAAGAGLGYESWRKQFRAATGVSPAQFRLRRRIEAAEGLLRRTSLPQREIAAALGFSDEHHLARHFRRVMGTTPGRYRHDLG